MAFTRRDPVVGHGVPGGAVTADVVTGFDECLHEARLHPKPPELATRCQLASLRERADVSKGVTRKLVDLTIDDAAAAIEGIAQGDGTTLPSRIRLGRIKRL